MPLCPLCTGVSQMNSPMAQTQSHNHALDGCVTYNWSYGHFCDFFGLFWPKFGCHQGRSHRGGHGGRVPRAPYHVPYIKMTTDGLSSELSFDEWHGVTLQRIITDAVSVRVFYVARGDSRVCCHVVMFCVLRVFVFSILPQFEAEILKHPGCVPVYSVPLPTLLLHVINHYTTCCFRQLCDPAPLFAIISSSSSCSRSRRGPLRHSCAMATKNSWSP